jgi:hypothetical protein
LLFSAHVCISSSDLGVASGSKMDEEDIKETLRDVLNELYSKETKKERTKPS